MSYQLEITVLSGVSAGDIFKFDLQAGDALRIGRADSNDIVLSDPRVSRAHAEISSREDGLYIRDLGSSSGTVHMGFKVLEDAKDARKLRSGDEFKIGDKLFRISIEGEGIAEKDEDSDTPKAVTSTLTAKLPQNFSKKPSHLLLLGLALVLLLLLLWPSSEAPSLPKQKSDQLLELPDYSVNGYLPGKRKTAKRKKDVSHIDKVQFNLPSSHVVIEYDYLSEAEIQILVDGAVVETLPAVTSGWQHQELIVRDVLEGKRRRLVFDNLSYPAKKGASQTKGLKRWAVRNVRATPLTRGEDIDEQIQSLIVRTVGYDKTPDGLFVLLRSFQQLILESLIELKQDIVSIPFAGKDKVSESDIAPVVIRETLEAIAKERRQEEVSAEASRRHLQALSDVLGKLESELWRRVESNFRRAKYSAKADNHIVVFDNLLAVKMMLPDEADYRWVRADRMMNDTKYVPKKIRKNPGKYR